MKKILFVLLFSFSLFAIPSYRYNTYYDNKVVKDKTNWEIFYKDLSSYGKVFSNAKYYIYLENGTFEKDELNLESSKNGYSFSFSSSYYDTRVVFDLSLNTKYIPFNAKNFDSFEFALIYWNKLMDEFDGEQF